MSRNAELLKSAQVAGAQAGGSRFAVDEGEEQPVVGVEEQASVAEKMCARSG